MNGLGTRLWFGALPVLLAAFAVAPASAQIDLGGLGGGNPRGAAAGAEEVVTVRAFFTAPGEGKPAHLAVAATIEPGFHIYSITQGPGGPVPSKVTVAPSDQYRVVGDFRPEPMPEVHPEPAFDNLEVEAHKGRVTWVAPLEISEGVNPAELVIEGTLRYQACTDQACFPPTTASFDASLATDEPDHGAAAAKAVAKPADADSASAGSYQAANSHVTIRGQVEPKVAAPGDDVKLSLSAVPAAGYHVYPLPWQQPADAVSRPTQIGLVLPDGWQARQPVADAATVKKPSPIDASQTEVYHEGTTAWTVTITVPQDAADGRYTLSGIIGYQACYAGGCEPPLAARFDVTVAVEEQPVAGVLPLSFSPAKYVEAEREARDTSFARVTGTGFDASQLIIAGDDDLAQMPVALAMLFGFLGGLILNLMPCVLPVVGLKILAFVEQSGHSRGRVLALNAWYGLGIMLVFMILASLAAFAGFGWGQLFSYSGFNITLAAVIFVMALSFLGVWEIPIPGFIGSGKAGELATREGAVGAFSKGIVTTVLATPCSGPFLGAALVWAVKQPPHLVYATFAAVGIGMASPYLLIGAFPRLVRFLPKPGAWMETFKHLMGFVLLGTVVFIFTFIRPYSLIVPTVALLFALWVACWWVGRVSPLAGLKVKVRAWSEAIAFALVGAVFVFPWLSDVMASRFELEINRQVAVRLGESEGEMAMAHNAKTNNETSELPWRPFSRAALEELTRQGKTVLVDFTADWCATCKTLERFVLNTAPTRAAVEELGIVPLLADWTDHSPEVTEMLDLLGSKQVPVLAIFPADRPNEPIVFREGYTRQQLLAAIERAGPSKAIGETAATAMRTP